MATDGSGTHPIRNIAALWPANIINRPCNDSNSQLPSMGIPIGPNMMKLASSNNNVFQVANMDEAMQRFSEIASSLYSISTSVNLGVNVPGGYDEGQKLRFTLSLLSSRRVR